MSQSFPEFENTESPAAIDPRASDDELTGGSLDERLAFMNLGEAEAEQLRELVPRFRPHAAKFVEQFYRHLFAFESTAAFLQDETLVARLKQAQEVHLQTLLEAKWDEHYVAGRRRVGEVHAQVGLQPHLFLGAYNQYLQFWMELLGRETGDTGQDACAAMRALIPAVLLDIGLTLDSYFVQLTGGMRQALNMYWKANNELRQFAELTSHDLKTPLGTVANLCEEALDEFGDEMPEGARKLIERAQQRVYRMSNTIDQLLAATTTNRRQDAETAIASAPIVAEVVDTLRPQLIERQINLRVASELPVVMADQGRLREIFMNLLTNAIKFSDKKPARVDIFATMKGEEAVFEIRDNGSGIPADDLQRIFSPFLRLRGHQHLPGSGLGLYFTRTLTEQLGGRVWVESIEGHGSTFFVALRKGA